MGPAWPQSPSKKCPQREVRGPGRRSHADGRPRAARRDLGHAARVSALALEKLFPGGFHLGRPASPVRGFPSSTFPWQKAAGTQSVPGGLRIGRLTALQPPAYRWGTTSQSTHHSSVLPPTCPPQYSQPRGSSGASSSLLRDPPPTRGRCSGRKSARSRSLCPLVRGPRGFGKGAGPCTTLERGLRRQMR